MDNATKIAIAKEIGKGVELEPGTYHIDRTVTLRVSGSVKKLEDVEYTPTVSIPLKTTLALVMKKAGFQRENARKILVEAMTEAIIGGEHGAAAIAAIEAELDDAERYVRSIIGQLPKKVRKGATKVNVEVTEVAPETATT